MAQDLTETRPINVSTALYRAAIGMRAQQRYLNVFEAFDAHGGPRVSWHWPAFLSALNWLVYRGLTPWAVAFAAASALVSFIVLGVAKLWFSASPIELELLLVGLVASMSIMSGLTANAVYHRVCNRRILAAVAASTTIDMACSRLAAQARHRYRWPAVAVGNAAIALLALGFLGVLLSSSKGSEQSAASATRRSGLASVAGVLKGTASDPAAQRASAPALSLALPAASIATVAPLGADNTESAASSASAKSDASGTAALDRDTSSIRIAQAQLAPMPANSLSAERKSAGSAEIALPKKQIVGKTAGNFAVQIGIFVQPANAENALIKVKAAGLKPYVETLRGGADEHQRVRVGPFATQAQAKSIAKKVSELGLPAVVVKVLPAGAAATP